MLISIVKAIMEGRKSKIVGTAICFNAKRRHWLNGLDLTKLETRGLTFPFQFYGDVGHMARNGWFYLENNHVQCVQCQ